MPTTLSASLASRAQTLGQSMISDLSQWYDSGVFYQNNMLNWYLNTMAPAALMATLAKYTTSSTLQDTYVQMIVEIVDRALVQNTNTKGLFTSGAGGTTIEGPDAGAQGQQFNDLAAIESVASIGWILNQLPPGSIPSGKAAKWLSVCQANCNYMDTLNGNTTYYINGNYQVHLISAYWFTAAASKDADKAVYEDMYERGLAFILNPGASSSQWAGYGLVTTVTGAQFDWSDYQVHLTETNGYLGPNPSPTFDGSYSLLQLDLLARLFIVNRDYRIVRLMNGISNKVEPLITTSPTFSWSIDCSNGSRKNLPGQGFQEAWYMITALLGCKNATTAYLSTSNVLQQWDNSLIGNLGANTTTGLFAPGSFRQMAITIAPVLEAAHSSMIKVATT